MIQLPYSGAFVDRRGRSFLLFVRSDRFPHPPLVSELPGGSAPFAPPAFDSGDFPVSIALSHGEGSARPPFDFPIL